MVPYRSSQKGTRVGKLGVASTSSSRSEMRRRASVKRAATSDVDASLDNNAAQGMDNSSTQWKRLSVRPEWRDRRLSLVASIKPLPTAADATRGSPMDLLSPLTQQSRPDVFEPKVVGLYRQLFVDAEEGTKTQGFWHELFLLKPDIARLREILNNASADHFLHMQHQSQQLVLQSIAQVKAGSSPATGHALDTLAVFFAVILAKKYTNPSADILDVLAGLENVDVVFVDLVATLERAIRDGSGSTVRTKAARAAISVVAGGYQTPLVSYFIQRDLFPALMKLVQELDEPLQAAEPILLTGLLANYYKFEVNNPYRVRLSDFVNDETMLKVVRTMGTTSTLLRDRYVGILDDTPAAWSLGGTLSYVGLGALAGAKPATTVLTEDQQKELFAVQPGLEAAAFLYLYDFTLANKLFCHHLITSASQDKDTSPPLSAFLSFASYLFQHAYRSTRASLYAYLIVLTLLIMIEDSATVKLLCDTKATIRLARQRPPFLPPVKAARPYALALIDILTDGINHNLRRRLDTFLYSKMITLLSHLLSYLAKSRTKLDYHWSELWRSLLSFARFLTTYAADLQTLPGTSELVHNFMDVLTIALTTGEAFLPDSVAYDDLFYKLVESGEALVKLRDAYEFGKGDEHNSINTLIGVSQHYKELIDKEHKGKITNLSPREVGKIIKQGYDTLSIEAKEGLIRVHRYREADHKAELKKIVRVAVVDAAALVAL